MHVLEILDDNYLDPALVRGSWASINLIPSKIVYTRHLLEKSDKCRKYHVIPP